MRQPLFKIDKDEEIMQEVTLVLCEATKEKKLRVWKYWKLGIRSDLWDVKKEKDLSVHKIRQVWEREKKKKPTLRRKGRIYFEFEWGL